MSDVAAAIFFSVVAICITVNVILPKLRRRHKIAVKIGGVSYECESNSLSDLTTLADKARELASEYLQRG